MRIDFDRHMLPGLYRGCRIYCEVKMSGRLFDGQDRDRAAIAPDEPAPVRGLAPASSPDW
jgi:hypothetical protein